MTLDEALSESLALKGGNFITAAFHKWSLDWSKYAVIKLTEKLLESEDVLFAAELPIYNKHFDHTSGLFVVTNIRVIFYYNNSSVEQFDTIPLNMVESIETGGSDVSAYLAIIGKNDTFQVDDKPLLIEKLHEVLNDLLYVHPQTAAPEAALVQDAEPAQDLSSDAADIAEALKSYKDLLDTGIITQEEFDAKKRQLLGL